MGQSKILSTGVLARDPASFNAHVDVVNLDPTLSQTVTVEIFDWGVDQLWNNPAPVPVSPSGPVTIGPHTHQSFIALITQSTAQPSLALSLYEIRITIPEDPQLVANCFALDANGKVIEGNTVLHAELAEVSGGMTGSSVSRGWKDSVRAATTGSNVVLSGTQTIDGVRLATADRVLVKDQTTPSQNGIYVVAAGAWSRAVDASSSTTFAPEMVARVSEGSINAHTEWFLQTKAPITLGTSSRAYARLLPWADVKAFGAKGDGTTPDDDAINAAINSGAGIILFPAGAYKITTNTKFTAPLAFAPGAILAPTDCTATLSQGLAGTYADQALFGGTGAISSVSHSGTGPAHALTVTGSPQGLFTVTVHISKGGPLGVAQFAYRIYDYYGYIGANTTAATFAIPGTGLILNFADVPLNNPYVATDEYSFTSAPAIVFSPLPAQPLAARV